MKDNGKRADWDKRRRPGSRPSSRVKYRIEVKRRSSRDVGYDEEPYVATAWAGARLVAVQFGSFPGGAFQKAWNLIQEDRERDPVVVDRR